MVISNIPPLVLSSSLSFPLFSRNKISQIIQTILQKKKKEINFIIIKSGKNYQLKPTKTLDISVSNSDFNNGPFLTLSGILLFPIAREKPKVPFFSCATSKSLQIILEIVAIIGSSIATSLMCARPTWDPPCTGAATPTKHRIFPKPCHVSSSTPFSLSLSQHFSYHLIHPFCLIPILSKLSL